MLMLTCSLPLLLAITFSSPLSRRVLPRSDGGSLAPMPFVSDTKSSYISDAGSVLFLSTTRWHTIDCLSLPAVSYIFDLRCFLTLRCTGSPCCEGMKSKELSGFIVAIPLTLIIPSGFCFSAIFF